MYAGHRRNTAAPDRPECMLFVAINLINESPPNINVKLSQKPTGRS